MSIFILVVLLSVVAFLSFGFGLPVTMGRQSDRNDHAIPQPTIGSSLIPLLNQLQQILAPFRATADVSLPQVAVVGSQSSGKSSVLEALVGRDFLPRGCDICTRRPLLLMLENRPSAAADDHDDIVRCSEWGEFGHLPGQRFYDFYKIRREIQAETEREAGINKRVSDKQIALKIYSPNVLNMTLIDLPGITKVPVGDQPSDIETRIRKMIMAYISQENCIILAVSPANSDLATSDALQMAREADPSGSRTIGVITKLDIMDRGTNASNFLLGRVVPLRLGYIGVVNRSQEDINHHRNIQEALVNEKHFFHNHAEYKGLSDYCGIPQLARKINQILEHHVRMVIPKLKAELNSRMLAIEKEMSIYGEVEDSKGVILLDILTRYCVAFIAMLDGNSQEISTKELYGGSRIHYIFQSVFVKSLQEVDPRDDLTDDDIRIAIKNATGPRDSLFVPEVPFQVLVKRQIARLLDPSLQCVRLVHDELIKISHVCGANELERFPNLKKHLDEVMAKFLHDGLRPAESMITNIIKMEMDYINLSNPNFIGGDKAIQDAKQLMSSEKSQPSLARSVINSALPNQGNCPQSNNDKSVPTAGATNNSSSRTWPLSSIFGSKASSGENSASRTVSVHEVQSSSTIQLRELPSVLRPIETTEHEALETIVTKILLRSYYDIVSKNMQDMVPKAIMHFLVNYTKRDLHNTFIKKLYREILFEELLQEEEMVAKKRKHNREIHNVLQQAIQMLDEVQYHTPSQWSNWSLDVDTTTGLPLSSIPNNSSHPYSRSDSENGI